jgi:predicted nucleic acid binding AN1-type Zn finger protein
MQNQYSETNNFGLLQLYPPKPKVTTNNKEPKKVEKKKKTKKKKKIKLHKCLICKIKLSIAQQQMTCKCNANFCAKHRLQNQHNCPNLIKFDEEAFKKKSGLGGGNFKQVEVL